MEEDIEQCEDLIKILDKTSETGKSKHTDCIRNLIARNKELEKHYQHGQEYINGEVFSAKQMHYIEDNYIDKSKVKKLIEKLDRRIFGQSTIYYNNLTVGECLFIKRFLENEFLEE